ncbi:hypothetical protein EVA_03844 [gut metagenome]|uniref:Uncharacterized protein n=1 Tax=gut metagenome TaxID=749906 RepID=J9GL06_9ZZZZ
MCIVIKTFIVFIVIPFPTICCNKFFCISHQQTIFVVSFY